ncbi:MAG: glycosyltransferase family 9 protein [Pseudomonadota bacterium]
MKILAIKQTSLGDVLHVTGHLRRMKEAFPEAELHVMTATSSAMILENHTSIDKLIVIDRYGFKKNWWRKPVWSYRLMKTAMQQIRQHEYDLAIDFQGLSKSVIFLYGARARRKFVKGKWPGLTGFHNRQLHAVREMDAVLDMAGIDAEDTSMEFQTTVDDDNHVDSLVKQLARNDLPVLLFSCFSRWQSKDWPLEKYVELARYYADDNLILFSGAENRQPEIEQAVALLKHPNCHSVAGKITLRQFAALAGKATLMVTGDSFPMHVSVAKGTPVVAIFGPTNPHKVGPIGKSHRVVQAPNCRQCENSRCRRLCLLDVPVGSVRDAVDNALTKIGYQIS